MINIDPQPESQTLFKSTLRGTAAERSRLLDIPTSAHLRTLFEDRFGEVDTAPDRDSPAIRIICICTGCFDGGVFLDVGHTCSKLRQTQT